MDRVVQLGNILIGENRDNPNQGRVYDSDGLCPTMNSMGGGGRQPHIVECVCIGGFGDKKSNGGTQWYQQDRVYSIGDVSMCLPSQLPGGSYNYLEVKKMNEKIKIRQATKDGFVECDIPGIADLNYTSSKTRRGRVQRGGQISPTLAAENPPSLIELGDERFYNFMYEINGELYMIRIRKLTPRECWRLMGFSDEDFHKAESVNSNTQLYKEAGNSIVKNCLVAIFGQMFDGKEEVYKQV